MALGENPKRVYGEGQKKFPATRMGNAAVLREALAQGKLDGAESAWRQALPIARKMYGEGSIYTQATLKELAACLRDQRKYAELAALYRESLALLRKASGNEHPKVVTLLQALAGALRAEGKLAEAEEAARRRGCHGVHLMTGSFNALPFYQKRGYTVFGVLTDMPTGHTQYFMTKSLV